MNKDLDILLDKCIDRMNEGDSLEECLASYPEQAKELEPLLRAIWDVRDACSPMPRATAKSVVRRRLDAALVNSDRRLQERQRRTMPLFAWPRVLATVTAIFVLALMGFGLYWILTPDVAPVVAQANFRLLLSDQENAIGDFEKLEVTITSIGMLRAGEEGGWEKIELEESVALDLTRLQGLNAQEIWGGVIPEGQYIQVYIYIEDAVGTLENGETVDVIIPSGNIQISKPFVVGTSDSVVNFVYDITVVAAGNEYVLLPQIDESGPEQEFHEVGEGALTLWVVDTGTPVTPGDNITVVVTFQEDPMPGAQVRVNGVDVGNTSGEAGQEGHIFFTVPYDEKLKVKAKITMELGELEGQLKIEFGDELTIEVVEGVVAPGQSIGVQVTLVTLQGVTIPIPGTEVKVKEVGVFTTDEDGRTLLFTVPYDDELEIKAEKNKLKGELEIDLEEEWQEDELTIQVIEGEVTLGGSITILVTFLENPVAGALVTVKGVGVFITDGDGRTLPFTVPYADELEIEAVKGELEGELEIDLEQEFEEAELTIQVVEGEVTLGESVTVLVTFRGNPVEGALVKVEDVGAFITSDDGRISFTIPEDADELEIEVKKGELKGELEIELQEGEVKIEPQEELEGELNLDIEGDIAPGGTVTLLVTFADQPVAGAEVEVNDEEIGSTDQDGTITFTIPEDADELDIEVKKGKLRGDLEIELEGEVKIEPQEELESELDLDIEGDIAPGGTVTLLVTFADQPIGGAEVEVNDEEIGSTDQDGTITFTIPEDADELEIEVKKGELKGELEIELQEAS